MKYNTPPDESFSETFVAEGDYWFLKRVIKKEMKTKTKLEERYFCIEGPDVDALPRRILLANEYGYKTMKGFFNAKWFYQLEPNYLLL